MYVTYFIVILCGLTLTLTFVGSYNLLTLEATSLDIYQHAAHLTDQKTQNVKTLWPLFFTKPYKVINTKLDVII